MKIVVGYTRVSTREQKLSLEAQASQIRDYCSLQGLEPPMILVEQGISGGTKLLERPSGKRLDDLIESGKVSDIVFTKLDRGFRGTVDAINFINLMDQKGVNVHFLNLGGGMLNTASPTGRLMITIFAGFGEFERSMIRERIVDALAEKKRRGEQLGRKPNLDPELERAVLDLRDSGAVWSEIASEVEKMGFVNTKGNPHKPTQLKRIYKRAKEKESSQEHNASQG